MSQEEKKNKSFDVEAAMLLYCLVFVVPLVLWAINYGVHYRKTPDKIVSDAIYYTRAYKLLPVIIPFFAAWVCYFLSSIGIFMQKKWGRILGILVTGLMTIWSFGHWFILILNDIFHPYVFSGNPGRGFGAFVGFFVLIIPIGLPALGFLIALIKLKAEK